MIFKPALIEKILCGTKTETRRPCKPGVSFKYEVGKVYGIQPGMGRPSIGRIQIDGVTTEPLQALNDEAAQREGFNNAEEFQSYWRGLYKGWWEPRQVVYVVSFHVVDVYGWICGCCEGLGFDRIDDPETQADFVRGANGLPI